MRSKGRKLATLGVMLAVLVSLVAAGGATALVDRGAVSSPVESLGEAPVPAAAPAAADKDEVRLHMAATDGWAITPDGREHYIFGFVEVPWDATYSDLLPYRGRAQLPAPLIYVEEGQKVYLKMTNIGFPVRPDLDDPHTIHWHGFPNAVPIFDGFPEGSVAIPVGRSFTYYYTAPSPGTYMWHCHFEPVEHIQMGMVGPLFVRPAQDGNDGGGDPFKGKYAYNDGDGSTEYDREFTIFVSELDSRPHELLPNVQEFEWTEYKPDYWLLNGRAYPDTLLPHDDPSLPLQPVSSLIRANAGDRVLLRFSNLGYEQHAIQLPGINFKVVGKDAKLLRGPDGADLTYWTNTLYVKPGESYDVIFTAPDVDSQTTYKLYNRNYNKLTNAGSQEAGGMVTEVQIFPGTLSGQKEPNK